MNSASEHALEEGLPTKACTQCPWLEKGQPLLSDYLRQAARAGAWFCCHVNLGDCYGAYLYSKPFIDSRTHGEINHRSGDESCANNIQSLKS